MRIAGLLVFLPVLACAQNEHANNGRKSKPMPIQDDTRAVAPALERYARGPLAELGKRPGLTPRDRSIVTIAALIARNQTVEMPHYFRVALKNGVKPREISEIITHLAFYSGWGNAMSAVEAVKPVFAERKIGADQLPSASPTLLSLERQPRRSGRQALSTSSGPWLLESCSTRPMSCSETCGSALTLLPAIEVWSR